jgi:hypothetical protein
MHYVTFWKKLQTVAGLEKLAVSNDASVAVAAQDQLAATCEDLFVSVKNASENIVQPLMQMRDSHRITGEKFAASAEDAAVFVQKLATAAFVDDLLETQLEKLSGAEYDAARAVQLLGREYAVHLMRGLFA